MKAFLAGLAIMVVLGAAGGVVYNYVGISAEEYFSTSAARLHEGEGMPEQYRGEEGQR